MTNTNTNIIPGTKPRRHRRVSRLLRGLLTLALATPLLPSAALAQGSTTQVVGGGDVARGEFRYNALIDGSCTGTLIHAHWVLTAAHCVEGRRELSVAVGMRQRSDVIDPATEHRTTTTRFVHPLYTSSETTEFNYDIALLKLPSPITTIQPIRVGAPGIYTDYIGEVGPWIDATVVGWGKVFSSSALPEVLQKLDTKVRDHGWMETLWPATQYLRAIHLGAAGSDVGGGLCYGDSGGPLIGQGSQYRTKTAGSWVHADYLGPIQMGVLSAAHPDQDCNNPMPARYARTDEGELLNWLVSTMAGSGHTLRCGAALSPTTAYVWQSSGGTARCGLSTAFVAIGNATAFERVRAPGCGTTSCVQPGTAVFTITLNGPSGKPIKVSYSTADGSATAASGDYQARSGTITFKPGETSKTVAVPIGADSRLEADEDFRVNLSGLTGPARFSDAQGLGVIIDGLAGA